MKFLGKTFLAFALFSPFKSFAATVRLERILTVGIANEKGEIVRSLERNEMEAQGYSIVDKEADATLRGSLTQLDHSLILNLSFDGVRGVRSRQIKLSSFDEIDTGVHRVILALMNNVSVAETMAQGEILSRDANSLTRLHSIRGWEFALGASWPLTNAFTNKKTLWALSFGYAWDIRQVFVELRGDVAAHFGSGFESFDSITLSPQWIWLDRSQWSLFAGPEFGFAITTDTSGGTETGFNLGADIGVLLLRHADINLDARLRLSFVTDSVSGGVPSVLSVLFGLHF